jgi:elongation factor 1-gamma
MASGTLYTYPENFRAYKAQIAARYSGGKVKVVQNAPEFKFGETNKSAEFLKKFPTGKVPAFESDNGVKLFESNAIAYYLANEELRGQTPSDAACVQQWIHFADSEILPASCTWVFPCMGIMQFNKQNTERAKDEVKKALSILNTHLATRTFLVGERISLADISVACNLLSLYQQVLEPAFRGSYVNTNRWFTTIINQPNVKAVIGDVKLCEKMAQPDLAKKGQEKGGQQGKKQEKKPQEKKQEKKKPEKKPEPEDDEDDGMPMEKPSKDPFAALPKGTFVMDDWKRCYSNEDTEKAAIPYFWKNFDKENYSIWFSEYKFPEELKKKKIFMTCNLVGGMFQRLDKMRKHAFGSVLIFGEDNNNSISGVWVWRGKDLAFELSSDLQVDYESYNWTKLNPDNEADKKKVNDYFLWEGDFGGKKVNQGKVFK